MKKDDIKVLREVQREADRSIHTSSVLQRKTENGELAIQLTRQEMKYAGLYHKAAEKLGAENIRSYQAGIADDLRAYRNGSLGTILDTSAGHLADLMIQNSMQNITRLWKATNRYDNLSTMTLEIAEEFIDLEKENINGLKKFL